MVDVAMCFAQVEVKCAFGMVGQLEPVRVPRLLLNVSWSSGPLEWEGDVATCTLCWSSKDNADASADRSFCVYSGRMVRANVVAYTSVARKAVQAGSCCARSGATDVVETLVPSHCRTAKERVRFSVDLVTVHLLHDDVDDSDGTAPVSSFQMEAAALEKLTSLQQCSLRFCRPGQQSCSLSRDALLYSFALGILVVRGPPRCQVAKFSCARSPSGFWCYLRCSFANVRPRDS